MLHILYRPMCTIIIGTTITTEYKHNMIIYNVTVGTAHYVSLRGSIMLYFHI